ncbi:IS4 family transposase [Thalassotalea hakodatensis]|nr:IS4 family transposase [Thalassotalea hakodatensis]
MPESLLCHNFFDKSLSNFNQARMKTLKACSEALIASDRLTLTSLGRYLAGRANIKHKIKRVDRFLNNEHLFNQQVEIYASLAKPIISNLPYLAIAVDWSGCCRSDYHLLRASLLVDGRSLVLYNMVVELKDFDTPETNARFLDNLLQVIGEHRSVYILSDGGFLTPWYTKVRSLGWHFIGRLRGTMTCKLEGKNTWEKLPAFHQGASCQPTRLGKARVTQHSPTACDAFLHLYKGKYKGRKGNSRFTKDTRMYRRHAHEPWLLATSDNTLTSDQVIKLYSKRMQIEQNFRDDKSQQYGFSWRFSKTQGVRRMSALCLIACLASLLLWFVGFEAEQRNWQIMFQANTIKHRRVLSFLTLAKQVIRHRLHKIKNHYLQKSRENFLAYYQICSVI